MRRKRSRIKPYDICNRIVTKDKEGVPNTAYSEPFTVMAEVWPAGGKVQAQVYGEQLPYIFNVRIADPYELTEKGYELQLGAFKEQDAICLFDSKPDYRIIAIKPYEQLMLEVQKI